MLRGTADLDTLARRAPTLTGYVTEPLTLQGVSLFQLVAEMRNGAREAVLPPSLHPTVPPTLSLQVWQVPDSPWGGFAMVVCRISCRGGVRARGFTSAAVASTEAACHGLGDTYGYPLRLGEIDFLASYSGVAAAVQVDGREILRAAAIDPVPLGPDDVQYTGTLNAVHVPAGLRLLQVEFQLDPTRVERLRPRLECFAAEAWGDARLDPYFPVTAALASGTVTFAAPRFQLKADELAFTGTERVGA